METLTMSLKERDRLTIMVGVKEEELTLVQAAGLMGVGYRQSKRIWRRYQDQGDAGLVHRLRDQPSARRKPPALRARVLARYEEERYADFGPTLMAEHLAKAGVVVDHETVRRRKQRHRQWRERKPSFGAMVQLDGSHHDWFEGRREPCVLMVMVDDATNRMRARFFEERPRGPATMWWRDGPALHAIESCASLLPNHRVPLARRFKEPADAGGLSAMPSWPSNSWQVM
jgi:hypothetical protein